MAVTSDGSVLANVAYIADLRSIDEVAAILKSGRVAGEVFLGVVLGSAGTEAALKHLDDASAEIAATSAAFVLRPLRRGQR